MARTESKCALGALKIIAVSNKNLLHKKRELTTNRNQVCQLVNLGLGKEIGKQRNKTAKRCQKKFWFIFQANYKVI